MPVTTPPPGHELRTAEFEVLFAATGWFARVPEPRRRALVAHGRSCALPGGARVYRLGDEPDGLYAVLSGEVRLVNYPEIGKQLLSLVLRPGRWFGELSVIDGGPRPHDAICVGPTVVLRVPMPDLAALGREDPGLYRDIAILGCQHQRLALDRIALMWGHSSVERLVRLLDDFAIPDAESGQRAVTIRQEDLAGMVGVSRQRLNQLLRRLEAAAMIRTAYGRIIVLETLRTASLPEAEPPEL